MFHYAKAMLNLIMLAISLFFSNYYVKDQVDAKYIVLSYKALDFLLGMLNYHVRIARQLL